MSGAAAPDPVRYTEPVVRVPGVRGRVRRWYARGPGFWDVSIGIVAPLVLVFVDRRLFGDGVLPLRPHSTLLVLAGCAFLAAWTKLHRTSAWWRAILAGPLLLGAGAALVIACVLLPMALIGLIVLVGVLGFVPWLTSALFLRAGLRALAQSRRHLERGPALALAALSAALVFIACWGAGRVAMAAERRATEVLVGDRPGDAGRATLKLKVLWWFPQVPMDDLRDAADTRGDADERLSTAFRDITGKHSSRDD